GRSATESTGRVVSELFLSIWEFLGSRGTACGSFGFFAFQTNPFMASPLLFVETHTNYMRLYSHADAKRYAGALLVVRDFGDYLATRTQRAILIFFGFSS